MKTPSMPVSNSRKRMQYALTFFSIGQLAPQASRLTRAVSTTSGKLMPSSPMKY